MAEVKKRDIVANKLRKDILAGRYGIEGGIPDEGGLAKIHNCARGTVTAALSLLEGEGLLVHRGRAYYVNNLEYVMTSYVAPSAKRHTGTRNYVKNVDDVVRLQTVPAFIADKAQVPHETHAVSCVRVSGEVVKGKEHPIQLATRYYFMSLSDEQVQRMQDDPAYDPAWDTSEELDSHDEITARPATQEELAALSLPASATVVSLLEIIRDKEGNLYMVHESALSPRVALVFSFKFVNKSA